MTAMAPLTSNHRKYRLPCFVMLPSLSLPPVVCCFGTSPIQAARPRPELNAFQSLISATRAVATIGPIPGISSSRRLGSHERCQGDLGTDGTVLCRQNLENAAGCQGDPAVCILANDLKQLVGPIAALS